MEIYLRSFDSTDGKNIYPWLCDKEVMELTNSNFYFPSKDYIDKWVLNKIFDSKDIYLAICIKKTKEMIGYLSVKEIDYQNQKAMWGGLLIGNKDYWGKGIATNAGALMLDFVFKELNINLFWAFWLADHLPSIKMGKKLGFKKVGVLPKSIYKNGSFRDEVIMRLLKEEYLINK